jgi:hypothetical protein
MTGLLQVGDSYVDSFGSRYLDAIKCEADERERIDEYIQLLRMRANGSLMTNAAWMRHFVETHRDYKKDSRVSPLICSDLMRACLLLADNRHSSEELHCTRRNSLVYSVDVCQSCGCIDIVPELHSCDPSQTQFPKPPPLPQAVPQYHQVLRPVLPICPHVPPPPPVLSPASQSLKPGVVSPDSIVPEVPEAGRASEADQLQGAAAQSSCYADCVVRKMKRDTGLCGIGRSSSMDRLQECLDECLPVVAGDSMLFKSHYR